MYEISPMDMCNELDTLLRTSYLIKGQYVSLYRNKRNTKLSSDCYKNLTESNGFLTRMVNSYNLNFVEHTGRLFIYYTHKHTHVYTHIKEVE